MDDFILMVLGAMGIRDFPILVQIPHNPHSKDMAEGLAHNGLLPMLSGGCSYKINERPLGHRKRHFDVNIKGVVTEKGRLINEFTLYIQMPATKQAREGVEAMLTHGLNYWLGKYCKNITVVKSDETHVAMWEPIGADMVLS